MIKPRHSALPHPPCLWARFVALAGLLLVLMGSTAQAAHVHGDWLPHHGTELRAQTESSITGDDGVNCPLCVAMHSAIAVVLAQQPAPPLAVAVLYAGPAGRVDSRFLHFSLFGRPPPPLA